MNENTLQAVIDHEEIQQYIRSFSASSDRSRYAFYAVMIATILIGIATWNVQSWGWPIRRIGTWYEYGRSNMPQVVVDSALAEKIPLQLFDGDSSRLATAREEYLKQFTARSIYNSSPIPGVSIDINDLGIVGGTSLVFLMLIMVFCMMREHENLHLAFYRVRRLCSLDDHAEGTSAANYLYHSLAMSQVLTSPPTLARWHSRGTLHHLWIIFFAPFAVHAFVVVTNLRTSDIGSIYGANIHLLQLLEVLIALCLLFLCALAAIYSRASALRWESVFFFINPGRRFLPQISSAEWLKLPLLRPEDPRKKRVRSILIETVRQAPDVITNSVDTTVMRPSPHRNVSRKEFNHLIEELMKDGRELARTQCASKQHELLKMEDFVITQNRIDQDQWTISGTWHYSSRPIPLQHGDSAMSASSKMPL